MLPGAGGRVSGFATGVVCCLGWVGECFLLLQLGGEIKGGSSFLLVTNGARAFIIIIIVAIMITSHGIARVAVWFAIAYCRQISEVCVLFV